VVELDWRWRRGEYGMLPILKELGDIHVPVPEFQNI